MVLTMLQEYVVSHQIYGHHANDDLNSTWASCSSIGMTWTRVLMSAILAEPIPMAVLASISTSGALW